MIKDCRNSHQLYTAKLNEEKYQKRLQDENAQKEKEEEQKARELEETDNDILVVKNGIKIADASILEGNEEIDKLLKQSNLDRNALATAHIKIAMGVKRKGELEENLKTIETKRKKLEQLIYHQNYDKIVYIVFEETIRFCCVIITIRIFKGFNNFRFKV